MRASELREKLFALQREHGDLPVRDDRDNDLSVEFNDDGEPIFVIC